MVGCPRRKHHEQGQLLPLIHDEDDVIASRHGPRQRKHCPPPVRPRQAPTAMKLLIRISRCCQSYRSLVWRRMQHSKLVMEKKEAAFTTHIPWCSGPRDTAGGAKSAARGLFSTSQYEERRLPAMVFRRRSVVVKRFVATVETGRPPNLAALPAYLVGQCILASHPSILRIVLEIIRLG